VAEISIFIDEEVIGFGVQVREISHKSFTLDSSHV